MLEMRVGLIGLVVLVSFGVLLLTIVLIVMNVNSNAPRSDYDKDIDRYL